ncbi:MAG: hypothetical protein NUV65_06975 [Candidatus Roizmanbacteria bacterium]|nr:hypothetical protein [Candidatus Roizmanbacteria bacterium]
MKYKLGEYIFEKFDEDGFWHSQPIEHRSASFDEWMLKKLGAEPLTDTPEQPKGSEHKGDIFGSFQRYQMRIY